MYANDRSPDDGKTCWRSASVRAAPLVTLCALALGGCPGESGNQVLPAQQELAARQPPAAFVTLAVTNDADYAAAVTVDFFIGQTAVHHAEGHLDSWLSDGGVRTLVVGPDEADRVVITARVLNSSGNTIVTLRRTYLMTSDFLDGDLLVYMIVYPPVALADATPSPAQAGQLVTLSAADSDVPAGLAVTYRWQQVAGQPIVTLTGADTPVATFSAPVVSTSTTLRFRVTLSDGRTPSTDEIDVLVLAPNHAPSAVAAYSPAPAISGDRVTLDGRSSYDPDADALTYRWTQLPGGPAVSLSNANQAVATFTVPAVQSPQVLTFRLTVTDSRQSSSSADLSVPIRSSNLPPAALSPASQIAAEITGVVLDGSSSSDPDSDPLSYTWTRRSGPVVTLTNAGSAVAGFVAPNVSTSKLLVFRLTVSDGRASDWMDVFVLVYDPALGNNTPPTIVVPEGLTAYEGQAVTLTASTSDSDGDDVLVTWQQTGGTYVLEQSGAPGEPTITAPAVSSYSDNWLEFQATATDGRGGTDTGYLGVYIRLMGDVNGDGSVDSADEAYVQSKLGTTPADQDWDPFADLNQDSVVDSADLQLVRDNLGRSLGGV